MHIIRFSNICLRLQADVKSARELDSNAGTFTVNNPSAFLRDGSRIV